MEKKQFTTNVSLDEIMANPSKYFVDHPNEVILDNLIIDRITIQSSKAISLLVYELGGKKRCIAIASGTQADKIANLSRMEDRIKVRGIFQEDYNLFYLEAIEIENYTFSDEILVNRRHI